MDHSGNEHSFLDFWKIPAQTEGIPVDMDSKVQDLLYEKYLIEEADQKLFSQVRRFYYLFKPILPRWLQVALRRRTVFKMSQRDFPAWPVDTSVIDLNYEAIQRLLQQRSIQSLPMISFWPNGADYCVVLTHDIESIHGLTNIETIKNIERKYGFRSSWNFVPERYDTNQDLIDLLQFEGFETGVHGLKHDGRLFETFKTFRVRAERINDYLQKWNCVGFRSPSNLRILDWIADYIKADYDSSCLSSEWYGIQPGGSCTVFPFMINQEMVELPITLQQDFTLLEVLQLSPIQTLACWLDTIKKIKALDGMVLINIHPDYFTSEEKLLLYDRLLQNISREANIWKALPREVASWWKKRHNSELIWSNHCWQIQGPAVENGKITYVELVNGELFIRNDIFASKS